MLHNGGGRRGEISLGVARAIGTQHSDSEADDLAQRQSAVREVLLVEHLRQVLGALPLGRNAEALGRELRLALQLLGGLDLADEAVLLGLLPPIQGLLEAGEGVGACGTLAF